MVASAYVELVLIQKIIELAYEAFIFVLFFFLLVDFGQSSDALAP